MTDAKVRELVLQEPLSKQPRYNVKQDTDSSFFPGYPLENFFITDRTEELVEREYKPDSRVRDAWLREFVRLEPNLHGVLTTVVAIDKNRGWRMVGGRNQVSRYTNMLHGSEAAPGMYGWRPTVSALSTSFWGTDLGGILEFGRQGRDGPIRALYVTDSTRCKLTGVSDFPLYYYPASGLRKRQTWRWDDFIRIVSNPSTDEKYHGLGFCAVSTCIILAQLTIALYQHDAEQLSAKAPRGLLLLLGISRKQWETALSSRAASSEGLGYQYIENLMVLASQGTSIDAKLIALSQLPKAFDLRDRMDMLMYSYALAFNYDPTEFWPVQFGALGRGDESRIQHEKATGKGRLDFALTLQEQLQNFFPDSLQFVFDQRDEQGDLLHASVNKAWADFTKVLVDGTIIDPEQAKLLLADCGVIPRAWTTEQDTKSSSDQTEDAYTANVSRLGLQREEVLHSIEIYRAAELFFDEPLVQYSWPANTFTTLWNAGEELLGTKAWAGC